MSAATPENNVDEFGVRTKVPNDDYSLLSYYLYCATKAVGVDIIQEDLIDYKNTHRLSRERKDGILQVAYKVLNPDDTTVGKVFYHDQGDLCGCNDNKFYTVTQVNNVFAIDSSILICGQRRHVDKIMVFKEVWLTRNYYTPINNQMSRIRQICAVDDLPSLLAALLFIGLAASMDGSTHSDHCDHCRGLDGKCTCNHGCPIKASTKCSKVRHCDHCKGFDGICECTSGCPEGIYSKCRVEHSGIVCDGCIVTRLFEQKTDIKGARFKCAECDNVNLCEECYNQGARKHNMTHPFYRIDRVGATWVYLDRRRQPKKNFAKGVAVKLVGLQAENMNGMSAVVEQDAPMPDGRILIRMSPLKSIKPKTLKKILTFQSGQVVALTGLDNERMNGITGMVVDSSIHGGHIMVRLHDGMTVHIKPEKLEVADIID